MEGPVHIPAGGPPQGPPPSAEIFAAMGEEKIFGLLEEFYLELENSAIRHLFPKDLVAASKKSAAFFVGLLGGPPLYHERYGPPRMRARHMPFAIDEAARQEWLACFERVLADASLKHDFPAEHLEGFKRFLQDFSAWMVNRA